MLTCIIESREEIDIPNNLVEFPIHASEGITEAYENKVSPIMGADADSGVGMFGHPPYVSWKGGEMRPIDVSTTLVAGEGDYASLTIPSTDSVEKLHEFVESIVSFAAPNPALQSLGGNDIFLPPLLELMIGYYNAPSGTTATLPSLRDKAFFARMGYLTSISPTFKPPFRDGLPMIIEVKFTFTPTIFGLVQSKANLKNEEWKPDPRELPHSPWKFDEANFKDWK